MIHLKSEREIELMREAGIILGDLLRDVKRLIKPGVTTLEIDRFAEEFVLARGARPAFKGYVAHFDQHYPSTLCTSVNESVVHEIPSNRVLKEGDIISVDVGSFYKGYYGDTAYTFAVGEIAPEIKRLLRVTSEALDRGIAVAVPGNYVLDISSAVQTYVEGQGFSIVREFTGHGIGRKLHEEPSLPNYGPPHEGPRLKAGMTLAIEPMVNMGTHKVKILADGWRAVTADGRLSAHFEHTIAITEHGPEILTLPTGPSGV